MVYGLMQQVLGYTPLVAGLTQLPLAVVLIGAAGGAPALIAAIGRKGTLAAGLAGLASGVINTTQQAGGALGLAVTSAVATAQITHPNGPGRSPPSTLSAPVPRWEAN